MLTRKHSVDDKRPFAGNGGVFEHVDADAARTLAMVGGDVLLILDSSGTIIDGSYDQDCYPEFDDRIGSNWIDTVTVESRPKVMEMLAAARKGEVQHWRQVNHPANDGDLPMKYVVVSLGSEGRHLALGRDLSEMGRLQQRLLQVQQALERDYLRMRQVEGQYRRLFEQSAEPVLIVEASSHKIREANPAAHALVGARQGSLQDKKLGGLFARASREAVVAHLGSALVSNAVSPIEVTIDKGGRGALLHVSGFSQDRRRYLLVRLEPTDDEAPAVHAPLADVIERMPDAFVLTDRELDIVSANSAFVELVGAAGLDQVRETALGIFLGRPGIDLDLIAGQVVNEGVARNVASVLRPMAGMEEEPVEISAVATEAGDGHFGFVIRPIGRRLRDLPSSGGGQPRSVEELTELVGRMPLKDIVRESTDLIERLCIEAALSYTSDNRASAAEILGLSRQSLYSKLHRYGLGNLPADPE